MRVIEERDADNWPQVAYTRGTDLSGSLEGAGGIGGLLARSHGFTNCSKTLTYWVTNNSGYCIENLAVWDACQTYVTDVCIENGETWNYSWPAVAGRQYTVWGDSCDFYFIQVYGDIFAGTRETRMVDFCGEVCMNISESGNPLCDAGQSGV